MSEQVLQQDTQADDRPCRLKWNQTSMGLLAAAEQRVLSFLRKPYRGWFVNIPNVMEEKKKKKDEEDEHKIWTIAMNEKNKNIPLVLVHGFAAGVGFWTLNLEALSESRPVYAFDVLGFGRSSRPTFSTNAMVAESQFVESIEEWRKQVGLGKFILLGHSLGGFLVTSYALKYPDRIHHLILADPWGYADVSPDVMRRIPLWVKGIAAVVSYFNPMTFLRAFGPWGPQIIGRVRSDITQKFSELIEDEELMSNYIYHCNAQTPSGEIAFKSMSHGNFGSAANPMLGRLLEVEQIPVPMTFICGSRSWIDRKPMFAVRDARPEARIDVHVIAGAGHHVYADHAEFFNMLVSKTCRNVGSNAETSSDKEVFSESVQSDSGYSESEQTSPMSPLPKSVS